MSRTERLGMERNGMRMGKPLFLGTAALLTWALLLVPFKTVRAQTPAFDLARDWSLTGTPFKGMPFGPDYAWSVCAVQLKPDGNWQTFDRAMHFTISNPWLDLYGIDGWWLNSSPVPRKPMAGKNVGQGNIPGEAHGVNYDWPIGRGGGQRHHGGRGRSRNPGVRWGGGVFFGLPPPKKRGGPPPRGGVVGTPP